MGENYNQSFKRRFFLRTAYVGAALGSSEVLKARNENDVVIPEKEMLQNSWMSLSINNKFLFDEEVSNKWHEAYKILGIDPHKLSPLSGRA